MSALSAVLAGRRAAEAQMLDSGSARRPTGTTYSGGNESTAMTALFTSRCKIQDGDLQAQAEEVGGRTSVTIAPELHLPASTAALTVGDEFVVTTPHALSTVPANAVYRVVAPAEGSQKTARRYQVERRPS